MHRRNLVYHLGRVLTTAFGLVVVFFGLTVLGWRRHGASSSDFSLLHVDWIFRPELPYWPAPMYDLAITTVGVNVAGEGLVILAWPSYRRWRTRPNKPMEMQRPTPPEFN